MKLEITEDQDTERQLLQLAQHIEEYRKARGTTKAAWLRAYPDLGTDKTYSKIVDGRLEELDHARWLEQYRHVWQQLETVPEDTAEAELYADLSAPFALCRAFLETAREQGNARVLLLQGDSGTGKTSAIRVLQGKPYGSRVMVVEATDAWKTRGGRGTGAALLRALARRLGITDLPARRDDLVDEVVSKLKQRRICIVVDEAHHLCPEGVNAIKHLVNQTPGEFILVALPVLWAKLESSREAWVECKQITGNRLAERITLELRREDVARFVAAKLGGLAGWTEAMGKEAAGELVKLAPRLGNLAFVRDVCKRVMAAVAAGEELSQAAVEMAIRAEMRSR
jgi:type II secretory pathway predicted ATPase ExeA